MLRFSCTCFYTFILLNQVGKCVEIGIPMLILFVAFSQVLLKFIEILLFLNKTGKRSIVSLVSDSKDYLVYSRKLSE